MKNKFWILCLFTLSICHIYAQNSDETDRNRNQISRTISFDEAKKKYNDKKILENPFEVLFLLSNQHFHQNDYTNALKYGNEAYLVAKKNKEIYQQIKINGLLGNIYESVSLFYKTREHLNNAEKLIIEFPLPDSLKHLEGNIYYLKAMNYAHTLDSEMALNYFDKSIDIFKSTKHSYSEINLKLSYLNKGFCMIEFNRLNEAEKLFDAARFDNKSNIKYPPELKTNLIVFSDFGHAKIHSLRKDPETSNKILRNIFKLDETHTVLSNRSDMYLLYLKNFVALQQIDSVKKYQEIYEIEIQKTDKLQQEIFDTILDSEINIHASLVSKIKTRNYFQVIILGVIGSLTLLFTWFYFLNRKRRQTTKNK